MPMTKWALTRPRTLALLAALAATAALQACSKSTAPPSLPTGIEIVSGDAQYTRKGTELEDPVLVKVHLKDGSAAESAKVLFQVIEGGGSLSRSQASTNSKGETTVRWTMGPATGTNRMRISLVDDGAVNVIATATSSDFYCPEEDPTLVRKFGGTGDLLLVTRYADVLKQNGMPASGVARIHLNLNPLTFDATALSRLDDGNIVNVVRDCAFAANGDFYLVRNSAGNDIIKIAPDGSYTHFATLESFNGAEIAMTPAGILVGCDEFGPFAVTCRDTLFRWEGATYPGIDYYPDQANNDAVAVDPTNDDLYFIALLDRRLYRLPLDGLDLASPPDTVATLERVEADDARGMVVDERDGSIYILVESSTEKAILKVTTAGVKTTEYDFFDRGAGGAAGIQNDLAIDRNNHFLYTLDTLNDVILLYQLNVRSLDELVSNGGPGDASAVGSSDERVGLAVVP